MSCTPRNLAVLIYAQGFTLWHYKANVATMNYKIVEPATVEEITAKEFFAPVQALLCAGDMILFSAYNGAGQLYVASTNPLVIVTIVAYIETKAG